MEKELRSNSAEKRKKTTLLGKKLPKQKAAESGLVKARFPDRTTENAVPVSQTSFRDELKQLLFVVKSVRRGDFSIRMQMEGPDGIISEIGEVLNDIIDLNENMANEFARVRNIVGLEGRLTERASIGPVKGSWSTSVDSVNQLIADLAQPTTEMARVITSVAKGDLSQKAALETDGRPVKGEFLRIGTTVNTMVDQLNSFASEVTRVAKEVGTEGKLGGQADVKGASGIWRDLTDNVNGLASNLTNQVRNIAKVTTAVAKGDLSQKITVDAKGEIFELKNTINVMVDQLSSFAAEVTRVAKDVGTEGKLGGQADVKGVSGTWKDLTDNVNGLASNLTNQVRNIAKVTTAVAKGDLSQKITVDAKGEIFELKNTINTMVDQLNLFAAEVTRVAKEVGTEGKLGGQAEVKGVSGTWKDLTDNVNGLAGNLTAQVRNIAKVTTAVANGDLSQKITVDAKGEIFELKNTINVMVDQLRSFAAEVTRVAKEVGTEGKLGGQAVVQGVSGTWKDLTDNVNGLAGNLTAQVRNIAKVTTAVANGDLSQKITVDAKGEILELKDTINTMVDQLNLFAAEVTRVAKEVGTEGKLGGQAIVKGVSGTWKDLTDNVNIMASNLTSQVRGIVKVVTAVAEGDLSQKFVLEAKGEVAALAETINSMTETLRTFADQVTTVAREVGIEGKLGGQAKVPGASGTWKDLTDNVNFMASNLTKQVRGIVKVVTAVAEGDLSQKFVLEAKGEVAALAETINSMTDTLRVFADQVTTVAREVGIEGKLGGQSKVPGAAGTWKDLTDNVNFMASNLTKQVRAIAEVSTAVTKGDLTRQITLDAQGEVAALKDNINQMIGNLKDTTQKNTEQDWLKTNLAKFSGMMQGQRSIASVAQLIMSELTPLVGAHQGAFFMSENESDAPVLNLIASYAFSERRSVSNRYRLKEGLIGQCAFEKRRILISDPDQNVVMIESAMTQVRAANVIVLPVLFEGELKAVIELASTRPFSQNYINFLDQLMDSIGVILNMISSSMRTEELLQELKRSNAELEAQAKELEEKAKLLEVKNQEVELASRSLEEKAEQLSLISKYKSEFLANMSHELRTPLNSLLILSQTLADNKDSNLTPEQVKYASTVHSAGQDLLALINEILDLSKVEAGKMPVDPREVQVGSIEDYLEQTFRPVAEHKGLVFEIERDLNVPRTMFTDENRLHQILKNLLSNAFKFTEEGRVKMRVSLAERSEKFPLEALKHSKSVIVFSVSDTGIGIPADKQKLIFEAFQQADGTTSRKYGGTGLGLTISREIARLLGGIIQVESEPGEGSVFRLVLPQKYVGSDVSVRDSVSEQDQVSYRPLPENADFAGKKVLIVDDDMRNIFALSTVLKARGMDVVYAENGRQGIRILEENGPIDIVLMDTMMPEMDGIEAIRQIRENPQYENLPIISLTAKAMKGDREKCLEAGASDYITKPVDQARLLSAMFQWMKPQQGDEAR
ncbi:MAG: HAMP domain-containing protein [Bdellovibrionaceae bacterium]|nr:HAMP domain-containing protein [Pseudobdellovibrionaceae bacterium]